MAYERLHHPLAPKKVFYRRLVRSMLWGGVMLIISLGIGILGYHHFAGLSWTDSLLNASMILGGMGPVDTLTGNSAKIFASLYALYSGVAFLGSFALLITPVVHRFYHRLNLSED